MFKKWILFFIIFCFGFIFSVFCSLSLPFPQKGHAQFWPDTLSRNSFYPTYTVPYSSWGIYGIPSSLQQATSYNNWPGYISWEKTYDDQETNDNWTSYGIIPSYHPKSYNLGGLGAISSGAAMTTSWPGYVPPYAYPQREGIWVENPIWGGRVNLSFTPYSTPQAYYDYWSNIDSDQYFFNLFQAGKLSLLEYMAYTYEEGDVMWH